MSKSEEKWLQLAKGCVLVNNWLIWMINSWYRATNKIQWWRFLAQTNSGKRVTICCSMRYQCFYFCIFLYYCKTALLAPLIDGFILKVQSVHSLPLLSPCHHWCITSGSISGAFANSWFYQGDCWCATTVYMLITSAGVAWHGKRHRLPELSRSPFPGA